MDPSGGSNVHSLEKLIGEMTHGLGKPSFDHYDTGLLSFSRL